MKNNLLNKKYILIILIVVLLGGILAFLYFKKDDNSLMQNILKGDSKFPIIIKDDKGTFVYNTAGKKLYQLANGEKIKKESSIRNGFEGGFAIVKTSDKERIIDVKGKTEYTAPENYELKKLGQDAFLLTEKYNSEANSQMINHRGKVIVKAGVYVDFNIKRTDDMDTQMLIEVETASGKKGVINEKGEVVLEAKYDDVAINQDNKELAVIITDDTKHFVASGKKDVIFTTKEDYRIFEDFYTRSKPYLTIYPDDKPRYTYALENNKLVEIGNYWGPQGLGNRYSIIGISDTNNNYDNAILDTSNNKITGTIKNSNKTDFSQIPSLMSNRGSGQREISVLTPFYSHTYEKVIEGELLGNGYYYITERKKNNNDESINVYNIYDSNGKKILTTENLAAFGKFDYTNKPYKVVGSGKNIAFICGKDYSTVGVNLIDSTGKRLIEGKDIKDMKAFGNAVLVTTDKTNTLYDYKGKVLIENVDKIDHNSNIYFGSDDLYLPIKINGKEGIYDFTNFKFIIENKYDSVGYSKDYYFTAKNNKEVTYFTINGKMFHKTN